MGDGAADGGRGGELAASAWPTGTPRSEPRGPSPSKAWATGAWAWVRAPARSPTGGRPRWRGREALPQRRSTRQSPVGLAARLDGRTTAVLVASRLGEQQAATGVGQIDHRSGSGVVVAWPTVQNQPGRRRDAARGMAGPACAEQALVHTTCERDAGDRLPRWRGRRRGFGLRAGLVSLRRGGRRGSRRRRRSRFGRFRRGRFLLLQSDLLEQLAARLFLPAGFGLAGRGLRSGRSDQQRRQGRAHGRGECGPCKQMSLTARAHDRSRRSGCSRRTRGCHRDSPRRSGPLPSPRG